MRFCSKLVITDRKQYMLIVTIMCHDDELSSKMSWVGCLVFTNRLSASRPTSRYMKVKIIGITKISRRIWLFSANKIKVSESFS